MKFIDEVQIEVSGGSGGNGAVNWRREALVPHGGPDGGDAGSGGAVILVAAPGLNTLIDFSFSPLIRAEPGGNGGPNQLTGANGADTIRNVPVGTQVYHEGALVADLSQPGARWIAARGGRGGRGNEFFKSATNQSPDYAQTGQLGDSYRLRLVLKSVADVGLAGFPNVGKSTLVAAISAARPKVADYPFTTLEPHLGVVLVDDSSRFVIADIPGLIPQASEGKGLGIKFLKHIERTQVIAQLVDVTQALLELEDADESERLAAGLREAKEQFAAIDKELRQFSEAVAEKPRIVVFSKTDIPGVEEVFKASQEYFLGLGYQSYLISSATHAGLEPLKHALAKLVSETRGIT